MFPRTLVAFVLAVASTQVTAGILSQRAAIGTNVSVDCQINRLTIVTGLIETKETLKDLKVIAKDNKGVSDTVQTTIDGISKAQGGIGIIFKAIVAGDKPPPEARQTVIDGLNKAGVALGSIDCTLPEAMVLVEQALSELALAGKAGDGVLATC